MNRSQLLSTAVKISGGQHSILSLNQAIEAETERLGQDKKGREHYTTSDMRKLEARNAEALKNLPEFKSKTNREEVEKYLDSLAKNEGIKLTAGQREHVINELAGKGGFSVTQGDPGTGKTFCSKIVERFNVEVLKPSGREQISLNVAYTGKAASEMALASGQPANTIDTFLNLYNTGKIQIVPNKGTQVILKVDEASFMGARQAEHLINIVKNLQGNGITAKLELVGDSKQMQSILAGDLFRQAQTLAKDGKGDFSALKEINRQKNPELLQVAQTLNRDGDSKRLGNNAKEALQMLDKQGRVTEISDSIKLIRATVDKYIHESSRPSNYEAKAVAGEKQSVLLVTGTNADRKELNHEIREARIRSGQIERGQTCKILTPAQQGPTADSYKPGQVIQFSGYRSDRGQTKAWGAPLQSQGVVQSINADNNTVNVTYQFTRNNESKTVTKTLDAAVMVNRTTAYNTEDRQFSAGDKIVMLKNDKSIDVKNGQIGEVVSLDDKGYLKVKIDGAEKSFSLNQYSNVDHGYAVTIHKSQGATVESVVQFANVRFGQEATNFNAMNVAITRATHEAHIMTNSIVELEKTVQSNSQKTTTLDRMSEFPLQQDHVAKHVTPSEQDIFQVPYHGAEHAQVDIETSIQKLESEMTSGTAFNEQGINKLDHAIAVLSSELAEYDQSIFHSQEVYQAQNEQIMETGQQQDIEQEM